MRSSSSVWNYLCLKNWRNTWYSTRIACAHSTIRVWKSWRMWRRSLNWRSVIPDQVTHELEDNLIPWIMMRSILCHPEKEKDHRILEIIVSRTKELVLKETAMFTQHHAKTMTRKTIRASHGPRVLTKEEQESTGDEKFKRRSKKTELAVLQKSEIREKFRKSGICIDVSHW